MPTTPNPSAAQEILRVASVALILVGALAVRSGLGVLKGRRGRKAAPPSPTHLALGVVLVLGGLGAMAFHREPEPEPEVITPERFSSMVAPAVSVSAPPPWRFTHDAENGKLAALQPEAVLLIETSRVTDSAGATALVNAVVDHFVTSQTAVRVGDLFTRYFDGRNGVGQGVTVGVGSSVVWAVERPGPLYTIIVCTSLKGPDAQTACDPVLSTLKWRAPGPR